MRGVLGVKAERFLEWQVKRGYFGFGVVEKPGEQIRSSCVIILLALSMLLSSLHSVQWSLSITSYFYFNLIVVFFRFSCTSSCVFYKEGT